MSRLGPATALALCCACASSRGSDPGSPGPAPPATSTEQPSKAAAAVGSATLTIEVRGMHNQRGQLLIALYDSAEVFPEDERATRSAIVPATASEHRFEALAPGRWAAAVVHDEDGNGELDTNLVGIPTEGFGFSNGAKARFGPPSFDAASFELTRAGRREVIVLQHF